MKQELATLRRHLEAAETERQAACAKLASARQELEVCERQGKTLLPLHMLPHLLWQKGCLASSACHYLLCRPRAKLLRLTRWG